MSSTSYLDRIGFTGDPFSSTNSETEDRLSDYFVPPPYFESVLGSPASPSSTIVFAPRGSGKTAQRRMIEEASSAVSGGFICVTYADFSGVTPAKASLEAHQENVCRLITLALLGHLQEDENRTAQLSAHEKQVLKYASDRYLSSLSQDEYRVAVQAVKSFAEKASDFWHTYGGVVAAGISILIKKAGLDDVSVPREMRERASGKASTNNYLFHQLLQIAGKLEFPAVYVLVDKVDETPATGGDAAKAFALIRDLLLDLPTLESPGVAFKFFLWDQTESDFNAAGGRPDRLIVSRLQWTVPELAEMLRRRLRAFSNKNISSFNELLAPTCRLDVHQLLAHLCNDSPRDMIRMAEQIIAEHTRTPGAADSISERTVLEGIVEFSKRRMDESYPSFMSDLRRLPEPSFTISRLASDVFRVETNTVRSKVQKWINAGAVSKVGELPNAGNRQLHLYAVRDLRLTLATARPAGVTLVLDNYALMCDACQTIMITSQSDSLCTECGTPISIRSATSLLALCTQDG